MTFAIAMSSYPYAEPQLSVAFKHSNQQLSGNVTHRHSPYSSSIVFPVYTPANIQQLASWESVCCV